MLAAILVIASQELPPIPPIIPRPPQMFWVAGEVSIPSRAPILAQSGLADELEPLSKALGVRVSKSSDSLYSYSFSLDSNLPTKLGSEGYRLLVHTNGVSVTARTEAGISHAVQTILQMIPPGHNPGQQVRLRQGSIQDYPRFSWRGLHLDCSRHFFTIREIESYLDYMAMLKLNVFHWHLIDEGGWRMEVKKYPKLTSVGAWRTKTPETWGGKLEFPGPFSGNELYGGFYTQDEIRHIVRYAAKRHIEVVPEVEMPGHILPAIWAYPELGCQGSNDRPSAIFPTYAFCVGKESTYQFLYDVLSETMQLFPSKIIHIGGDEVNQGQWLKCSDCRRFMARNGIKDAKELQSAFMKRIEGFLNSKGRLLMGWDEILEGGLAPKAMVMSWRGTQGGIEAAKGGHKVVMSPTSHCYFDYSYLSTPTEKVYDFDPIPEELAGSERDLVLGGQANVWTEWIPDFKRAQYMIFPRILAMSEALWSAEKDKKNFLERLDAWYPRLTAMGVDFFVAPPSAEYTLAVLDGSATVSFRAPSVPGTELKYRISGGQWKQYIQPVKLNEPGTVEAAVFKGGEPDSQRATVSIIAAPTGSPRGTTPGMVQELYRGKFSSLAGLSQKPAENRGGSASFDLSEFQDQTSFALAWSGWLQIPKSGEYTFTLGSDDGSRLWIGGALALDNDALQAYSEKSAKCRLVQGWYPVRIEYFDGGGARRLRAFMTAPDGAKRELSPLDFVYER